MSGEISFTGKASYAIEKLPIPIYEYTQKIAAIAFLEFAQVISLVLEIPL